MLHTAQYRQEETENPAAAQTDDAANSAGHVLDPSFMAKASHAPKEQGHGQGAAKAAAEDNQNFERRPDASGVKIM